MKILKRILVITIVLVMMTTIIISWNQKISIISAQVINGKPVRAGVLLHRFDDAYISLVRENLEEIQKENEGKIEFNFFDGKEDQSIQNRTLDTLLEQNEVDLILLNLVDTESTQEAINKIKERNIPVVLFNREPINIDAVRSYKKAFFVGTNADEAGVLQGKVIIDAWNKNKQVIDKNRDNILQYIMLMGPRNNLEAIARTKYSISTINEAGIKTKELALKVCNWEEGLAKEAIEALFLNYGDKIEAIIANNDSMAIGAIEALQEYGYNNGDKNKTILVVGVDAIPEAQELIKKGFMTGTVIQDAPAMAKALYLIGMNLANNKDPLDGTDYKFDQTGVAVRIPYKEYKG
jgi:methyl-galactoside transport system substrate-binding protein